MREQRVLLEHEPDIAVLGVGTAGAVVDQHAADVHRALVGGVESGDDTQQGRLAAPAGADERQQLAVGDFEIDVDQRHASSRTTSRRPTAAAPAWAEDVVGLFTRRRLSSWRLSIADRDRRDGDDRQRRQRGLPEP